MKTLSLYIHIPFCVRKCHYCDFYSIPVKPDIISKYIPALVAEMEIYTTQYADYEVSTIYFGGGSPNLLSPESFTEITQSVRNNYNLHNLSEFTFELNPADITLEYLKNLKTNGVNRISLGGQSFHDQELQMLGRIHRVDNIIRTIELIQRVGFDYFGIDLIYGIPDQTMDHWQESLKKVIETGADHLSLYNLSYEEGTVLHNLMKAAKIQMMETDLEEEMYLYADHFLKESGFQHYEISNWAKPACRSRHNQVYWNGEEYLGLGPSAHSFNGQIRRWNVSSVNDYTELLRNNKSPVDTREILDDYDREIEFLFLKLRTGEGFSVSHFANIFLIDFNRIIEKLCLMRIGEEYWQFDGQQFKLTPKGWFVSDTIIYNILSFIEEIKVDHQKDVLGSKGNYY